MIENELTYLVAKMPSLKGLFHQDIEQHFISVNSNLRIRATNHHSCELTRKLRLNKKDRSRQEEINIPLSRNEFEEFRTLSKRFVVKTRYLVPLDHGLTAELDVFHGDLEGLVWVEVEFKSEKARAAFKPPKWFGRDISQEKWAGNNTVAGKRYEDLVPFIEHGDH